MKFLFADDSNAQLEDNRVVPFKSLQMVQISTFNFHSTFTISLHLHSIPFERTWKSELQFSLFAHGNFNLTCTVLSSSVNTRIE